MSEPLNPHTVPPTRPEPGRAALERAQERLRRVRAERGSVAQALPGRALAVLALSLLLLALAHVPTFGWMFDRWYPLLNHPNPKLSWTERLTGGDSYYSHGPLVPLVCLVLAWVVHQRVGAPVQRSRWASIVGWLGFVFFALCHLLGVLARYGFVSGFCLIGSLASLLVLWGGWPLLRAYVVPLALLVFMVPFPMDWVYKINFAMKMFAAKQAVAVTNQVLTIPAIMDGANVYLPNEADGTPKMLTIANACGGLRSMIALTFFGSLFALICRLTTPWRLFMLAMAVPTALACNVGRIASLNYAAHHYGVPAAAEGAWFHDLSGLAMFALALAFMFTLENVIIWTARRLRRPWVDDRFMGYLDRLPRTPGVPLALQRPALMVSLAAVAAVSLSASVNSAPAIDPGRRDTAAKVAPAFELGKVRYTSRDMPLDEKSLAILENPDYVYRRYFSPDNPQVAEMLIVFSPDNRKAVHPPDVCLEGAGLGIIAKREDELSFDRGAGERVDLSVRELVTASRHGEMVHLFVYKCGSRYTPSFIVQQATITLHNILRKNASGALIRFSVPVINGDRAQAQRFALDVARALLPDIDRTLRSQAKPS